MIMDEVLISLKKLANSKELFELRRGLGQGSELYIVGGSVRDCINKVLKKDSGKIKTDIDVASKLRPNDIKERLERAGVRVVDTGITHGTLTAVINGIQIEITTFREASARNESRFSNSIEEDLAGRDFTINAIAYDIERGSLIDLFGGIKDLQAGVLRCVGKARERLNEDPLRLLRAVRFGVAQGRLMDEELVQSIKELAPKINDVSVERVRDEFSKILVSPNPKEGVQFLLDSGLLAQFIPEILPCVGFEQNEYHIHDVFGHILDVLADTPPDLILRLVAFFHDIGKPATLSVDENNRRHFYCHETKSVELCKQVMNRLKYSNDEIHLVSLLVAEHMRTFTCGAAGVRRIIRDLGEAIDLWLVLKRADKSPTMPQDEFDKQLNDFQELLDQEREKLKEPSYGKLAVNGDDILALGIKASPLVGEILRSLEEVVLEDPSQNKKDILLQKAKDIAELK